MEQPGGPVKTLTWKTICFLTDWTDGEWMAHEPDDDGPCPKWHEWLQVIWFHAHNNRLYRWSTEESP